MKYEDVIKHFLREYWISPVAKSIVDEYLKTHEEPKQAELRYGTPVSQYVLPLLYKAYPK